MKKWLVYVRPTLICKSSALCPHSICISQDRGRKQQLFPSTADCVRNGDAVWFVRGRELIVKYYVDMIRASFCYWMHPIHHSQFKFMAINPLTMEVQKMLFQIINNRTRRILTTNINKGFLPYMGTQNFASDITSPIISQIPRLARTKHRITSIPATTVLLCYRTNNSHVEAI